MQATTVDPIRILAAWQARVSGCVLDKPVEAISFQQGRKGLCTYLEESGALPLRDYISLVAGTVVDYLGHDCCGGKIVR